MLSPAHTTAPPPLRLGPCLPYPNSALRTPEAIAEGTATAQADAARLRHQLDQLRTEGRAGTDVAVQAMLPGSAAPTLLMLPADQVATALEAELRRARHRYGRWIATAAATGAEG